MKLAAITCTLNLNQFAQSKLLELFCKFYETKFKFLTPLILINHGEKETLTFGNECKIISQENFGGTGGFVRGILEAKKIGATHFLLMDDDAIPELNTFEQTLNYYLQNDQKSIALHGTMFSTSSPEIIQEAGVWIERPFEKKFHTISRLKGYKVSNELKNDPMLLENIDIDYGAWWFFACPMKVIETVGLPLPFFIHGDDREYGLRLKLAGIPTLPLPGLKVFHPIQADNLKQWYSFFFWRNVLIEKALYAENATFSLAFELFKKIFYRLLAFQYDSLDYIASGILAYLKGPDEIKKNPTGDVLFAKSIEKKWPITYISKNTLSESVFNANKKIKSSSAQEFKWTFFLNGLFFPKQRKRKLRIFTLTSFKWISVRKYSRYGISSQDKTNVKLYTLRYKKLFEMSLKIAYSLVLFILKNKYAKKKWKENFPTLTTETFWAEYLSTHEYSHFCKKSL
jgi:galactofuranosylgalactofuranosylrhamnosyl-N-acetylglucosaminyl-diphospho-decaprenol beta-1,5/1,6-galactofuranosyltransferase